MFGMSGECDVMAQGVAGGVSDVDGHTVHGEPCGLAQALGELRESPPAAKSCALVESCALLRELLRVRTLTERRHGCDRRPAAWV